ncbi:MFS transporter [Streptomyces syringium]|uniref:MFS transporter n=1 Tax=Streptomyces syringium TaxID=76729 RepID=UPI003435D2CC
MPETSSSASRRRAPAMSPDQRRAMIVAAALPLIVEYGASVSTAKRGRAAGIGEGAIFRVFADKDALLAACKTEAVRPGDTVPHLESIALDQPPAARLTEAAEVMSGHMARLGAVAGALAATGRLEHPAHAQPVKDARSPGCEAGLAAPRATLAALFEPDRETLRLAPERLAGAFQLMLMSTGRPRPADHRRTAGSLPARRSHPARGTPVTAPDAHDKLIPRRRRLITFALLGCAFLAMLDGTLVGTALSRIVEQTSEDDSWYVWPVTAYLLTSSVSVPVYGRFSDRYGRRRLLLGGLAIFLIGSLACGLAGSKEVLIVSRGVQKLGAGALLTLGMALIRDLHPPSRAQGLIRMQTVLATMMVLGMVGGPVGGGLLADHAGWRRALWLNL